MAAGKNAVCRILEERGFIALDADRQVHGAIEKAAPEIIKTFSNEAKAQNITLTDENGRINRRELGRLLFTSKELLSKQESIVYPVIIEETKRFIQKQQELKSDADIILNATVLYKTPELLNLCKYIIYYDQVIEFYQKTGYSAYKIEKLGIVPLKRKAIHNWIVNFVAENAILPSTH